MLSWDGIRPIELLLMPMRCRGVGSRLSKSRFSGRQTPVHRLVRAIPRLGNDLGEGGPIVAQPAGRSRSGSGSQLTDGRPYGPSRWPSPPARVLLRGGHLGRTPVPSLDDTEG